MLFLDIVGEVGESLDDDLGLIISVTRDAHKLSLPPILQRLFCPCAHNVLTTVTSNGDQHDEESPPRSVRYSGDHGGR